MEFGLIWVSCLSLSISYQADTCRLQSLLLPIYSLIFLDIAMLSKVNGSHHLRSGLLNYLSRLGSLSNGVGYSFHVLYKHFMHFLPCGGIFLYRFPYSNILIIHLTTPRWICLLPHKFLNDFHYQLNSVKTGLLFVS